MARPASTFRAIPAASTVTFQGNVTVNTGANNAINVTSNTGTNTVTFSGGAKDVDTTSGTALNLTANTTATTVSFTNGGLDVDSTTGTGLAVGGQHPECRRREQLGHHDHWPDRQCRRMPASVQATSLSPR